MGQRRRVHRVSAGPWQLCEWFDPPDSSRSKLLEPVCVPADHEIDSCVSVLDAPARRVRNHRISFSAIRERAVAIPDRLFSIRLTLFVRMGRPTRAPATTYLAI